jgi:uncharacterized protein YcaQ
MSPAARLDEIPLATARRIFLGAHGLLADPERPATAAAVEKLIGELGFVQIDSINVVERAHHLTLGTRLSGYRPAQLARLLEEKRALFEHWTHDASVIPRALFPHWKPRFARFRVELPRRTWWAARLGGEPEKLLAEVRARVRRDGPRGAGDFEGPRLHDSSWWSWKPHKAALEHLWLCGELAVVRRVNFQKVYDLAERVFPAEVGGPAPSPEEHIDWACRSALGRLGFATATEIAAFWRAVSNAQAAAWCRQAERAGELQAVVVEGRSVYTLSGWRARARRLSEPDDAMRLLCPFDPLLRDRARTQRLFGFDYRFEAFTPKPQRRYGYYVMPLLQGDRLVGRVDPKLNRAEDRLEIAGVWWEAGARATRARRAALEGAVASLAKRLGAGRFTLPRRV